MNQDEHDHEIVQVRMASAADGDAFVRFNRAMALETGDKKLDEEIVES